MKRKAKPQTSKEFSAAVGRALRRAATVAGKTAYARHARLCLEEGQSRRRKTLTLKRRRHGRVCAISQMIAFMNRSFSDYCLFKSPVA
jgi:hypothetical protein